MKDLLQSRFVSNYGMIFVLMLLCAYFSVATIDQQNPVTVRAANKIVAFLNDQPPGKNVLVVVPSGVEDLKFSQAIQQGSLSALRQECGICRRFHIEGRR